MPEVTISSNRMLTSREYKILLSPFAFRQRASSADEFWALISYLIERTGGEIVDVQDEEEERQTWYLDTPAFELRRIGASLRLRQEDKLKITLKHRSSDRYLAASQDLTSVEDGAVKFEEDVLPLTRKFAHSTSIKMSTQPDLATVAAAAQLFPGLQTLGISAHTALTPVNGFQAREIMRKVGKARFGDGPKVKFCLNFWYAPDARLEMPLVAEFSFDYDLPDDDRPDDDAEMASVTTFLEQFPLATVTGAQRLFDAVQQQSAWLAGKAATKTELVYEIG